MAQWVQYLDVNPFTGQLYEPCGDRCVLRLDSRNSLKTMIADAQLNNGVRRPVYPAFKIIQGERLLQTSDVTGIITAVKGGA